MCQGYVVPDQAAVEREFAPSVAWWRFSARYNVRPEQFVPSLRVHDNQTEGLMMRWGLIPAWVEGELTGPPRSWVHAHRIERSKSCGAPWENGQRCILPMAGFYVWQLTAEKYRQPFYVRMQERAVFGVAAVWERWSSEEEDVVESCAIVTVPANELVSELAGPSPGMPGILKRKDYETWLKGSNAEAQAALRPYEAEWMYAYPVSPRINSAAADDAALIRIADAS